VPALASFGWREVGPVCCPMPDDAPAAQVRAFPRQLRASAQSSFAATSRSRTVAPPFVADQGLAGAVSAAPWTWPPARWSQGWSLIAGSIVPASKPVLHAAIGCRRRDIQTGRASSSRQPVRDCKSNGAASSPRPGAVSSHLQRTMEAALRRKVARATLRQRSPEYLPISWPAHAGLWISADAPASPSSPTRCQHCRCPGPALRCVRLTGTSSAVTTFGRRHRCFSSASIDSHGDPDQSLTH
jgi:hypothetical protein